MKTAFGTEVLLSLDRGSALSLRAQLERQLRLALQQSRLRCGAVLPSTRTLAADLGLSRGVVVEAYEQLAAEGYLSPRRGSGTRVAASLAMPSRPPPAEPMAAAPRYDFRPGVPDLSLFPRERWFAAIRRALGAAPSTAFGYPDAQGAAAAREALAAYLNRARATRARAEHILVCGGTSQAIDLICRVLRARGVCKVAVEDPSPGVQCSRIQAAGLEPLRVPVDAHGIRVDHLERTGAGAVLVMPAHQFPSGAVLAPGRRAALLEWAARHETLIIEDDYDAEYRYDREPIGALQGLAPERVLYVGTTSKTLSPALRLGWLLAPAALRADLVQAKLHADRGTPMLEQLALAEFLHSGEMDRHLRRTRLIYRRRRDALVAALARHLPSARIHGVAAGLHLMVELDGAHDEGAIVEAALQRSIRVDGAAAYRAEPRGAVPAFVMGYGGLLEAAIADGVKGLASVLAAAVPPARVACELTS